MRLLLDTHVLLWWLTDDRRLGAQARALIANADNSVYVSAASAWEISIKRALGKLRAPPGLDGTVEEAGFEKLAIGFQHAERAGALPSLHSDPFDRMLIAQALLEDLVLVTADKSFAEYGVQLGFAGD